MKNKIKNLLQQSLGFSQYQRLIETKNNLLNKTEARQKKEALQKMTTFYAQFLNEGDLCFDVGANMGNRIEAFLKLGARPVAIEPQDNCCAYLRDKYKDRIILVQKGCGAKEEEKEFFVSDSSTISSFSEEWIEQMKNGRFKEHSWEKSRKVQLTTLDHLIGQFGLPQFIKIDVEGFEPEVLKGLSNRIPYISFEYTEPEQHANTVECINRLIGINTDVKFNYSILETMSLSRKDWFTGSEMLAFIETEAFISTGFGDIYVRN